MLSCYIFLGLLYLGLAVMLPTWNEGRATVRILMEPGCGHCRNYMVGPVKAAIADDATANAMDLEINPFGNSFYAIPDCKAAATTNDAVPGCGGDGGYDMGKRQCYNQKCGSDVATKRRAGDCFSGPLVHQFGFLQMYASRYYICAKALAGTGTDAWKTYVPFIICMEEKWDRIHDGASTGEVAKICATHPRISYDKLAACYSSDVPDQAFMTEAAATPDHPGVPWVTINGKEQDESYEKGVLIQAVRSTVSLLHKNREKVALAVFLETDSKRNITC